MIISSAILAIDRAPAPIFAACIASLLDAMLTLIAIGGGASEANPAAFLLLSFGWPVFLFVKAFWPAGLLIPMWLWKPEIARPLATLGTIAYLVVCVYTATNLVSLEV